MIIADIAKTQATAAITIATIIPELVFVPTEPINTVAKNEVKLKKYIILTNSQ